MSTVTAVACALKAILDNRQLHTATVYLSPRDVVRVSRRLFKGKVSKAPGRHDLTVTLGRPNYKARAFIKTAQKAGEPFPIRKVQLTFPPKRRG